jgi:ubiquinone/menaquinone biosynthesis C-methylase UbiE
MTDPAKTPASPEKSNHAGWGASYRKVAAEKWRRKSARMGGAATAALVEFAAAEPGMRVLDLASGTGEPAISLAAKVGPGGEVTGIDLDAGLLQLAEGRARERHLQNIRFQQADAHTLPFPDSHFDLITSRLGVMFFSDIGQAMREARRVLKNNGRLAFLVWGPLEQPYFQSTIALVHRHVGGPLLQPGSPNMFRFAMPGSLSAELVAAGFRNLQEQTCNVRWVWEGTPEEVWQYFREVTVPFRHMLERVPMPMAPAVEREVLAAIRQYYDGVQVNFTATFILAGAEK